MASIKDIPVTVVGPGSQPSGEQQLSYIDMPSAMDSYTPPSIPDLADVARLDGAREAMAWLRRALAEYDCGAEPLIANLNGLDSDSRELVNQILGEGEVSVTAGDDGSIRTQEARMAGIWRTIYTDGDGQVACDLLEVADAPHTVRAARNGGRPLDTSAPDIAAEVPNALPILVELESRLAAYEEDGTTHSINLTLLPLSDAEVEFLDARLGRGDVDVLSRAYGKCEVISTLTPNVWWIRYYNSMGTLILNTLEIVDTPAVVCAAAEDLQDSALRLEEILAPYLSEVA